MRKNSEKTGRKERQCPIYNRAEVMRYDKKAGKKVQKASEKTGSRKYIQLSLW
jgi:hypothetical protein